MGIVDLRDDMRMPEAHDGLAFDVSGGVLPCRAGFFFSSRRRHTRCSRDWSSDVCSSDLLQFPWIRWVVPPRLSREYLAPHPRNWRCCMSGNPLLRTRATLAALAGALTLTMVSTGCDRTATEAATPSDVSLDRQDVSARQIVRQAENGFGAPVSSNSAAIPLAYYELSLAFTKRTAGFTPPVQSRAYAYMGLTLYEALVSGMPGHRSIASQLNGIGELPAPTGVPYHWPLVANAALAEVMRGLWGGTTNRAAENIADIDALEAAFAADQAGVPQGDRKSTRLNSSHGYISYAVFCLKKKKKKKNKITISRVNRGTKTRSDTEGLRDKKRRTVSS